jgi:hypothetical protein
VQPVLLVDRLLALQVVVVSLLLLLLAHVWTSS